MEELTKAIALVERVMQTLRTPQEWSMFLHQYPELYAQAAITEVRRKQDAQARALLTTFTRIAGNKEIVQQIKVYENTIPTGGDEMTEAEIQTNKDLLKRLKQLRKGFE